MAEFATTTTFVIMEVVKKSTVSSLKSSYLVLICEQQNAFYRVDVGRAVKYSRVEAFERRAVLKRDSDRTNEPK